MSDATMPRPTSDDRKEWNAYWTSQGEPWRSEPEIVPARQQELAERRASPIDIARHYYPFANITLTRADIEWLISTAPRIDSAAVALDGGKVYSERVGLDLRQAQLRGVNLQGLPLAHLIGGLTGDAWRRATVQQRIDAAVILTDANLSYTHLEGAILTFAHLEGATLRETHLEGADLFGTHLAPTGQPQDNGLIYFDINTKIDALDLADTHGVSARMAGIHWGDTNITNLDWSKVVILGDEITANTPVDENGTSKIAVRREIERRLAVQAYRQIATRLRAQGNTEDADRFWYRSQLCQRTILKAQSRWSAFFGSLILDLLAGYGYKPGRSMLIYVCFILSFGLLYFALAPLAGVHFNPLEALIFSVTSFHGRGFNPGTNVGLSSPIATVAAVEAIIGLVIEISFIATFTQRFFSR